jgi:hypothetical protein
MSLKHSKKELKLAKDSLESMKKAENIKDFEKNWKNFLNYLEKVWKKAERECQSFRNKFEPWQSNFKNERKEDPLLQYLKNARDADEHTIEEFIEKSPQHILITSLPKEKSFIVHDSKVTYEVTSGVQFYPEKIVATSFTNSGKLFYPPCTHLGKQVNEPNNPILLAELGSEFYEDYLSKINKKFF